MKTTKNLALISIVLLSVLLFTRCEDECNTQYEAPIGMYNDSIANQKEELYKQYAFNPINEILANGSTPVVYNREVWFDLENLENYIHYVKTKSAELGYENLGLRVYQAAEYDKGVIKTTMFFSPTHRVENRNPAARSRGTTTNINSSGIDNGNYGTSGEPAIEFPDGN